MARQPWDGPRPDAWADVAIITQQEQLYDPERRYQVVSRDFEYVRVGDEPLEARVYQPQGPGPFPGLLDVHGGSWDRAGSAII